MRSHWPQAMHGVTSMASFQSAQHARGTCCSSPVCLCLFFNGIDGPFINSDQNTVYNTSFFCCYLRIKITVPLWPVSSAGPSAVVVGGKATLRTHSRDLVSWKKRSNVALSDRLGHFASIHLSKSLEMRRYEFFTVCVCCSRYM